MKESEREEKEGVKIVFFLLYEGEIWNILAVIPYSSCELNYSTRPKIAWFIILLTLLCHFGVCFLFVWMDQ